MKSRRDANARDKILSMFNGESKNCPVCSSPLVTVTLEQMAACGSYYPSAHHDPEAMARLSSFVFNSIGFQGIRIPFDLCVEAEAFGCKIRYGDKESTPVVTKKAFEEGDLLPVPEDIFQKGRFQAVFEAIRILRDTFKNEVAIYTGMVGPLTLLGALYDATTVMWWPIKKAKLMYENLKRAADFLVQYATLLFENGGDVLSILEPNASGDLFSRKYFQRHLIPVYQRMREKINQPIVLHICGKTENFLDLLPQTGFEAFSFGPEVSVQSARLQAGDKILLIGNIHPYDTLLFGTPERVYEESLNALEEGIDILAPGCGVNVKTPTENLMAMVKAVEEFNIQMNN